MQVKLPPNFPDPGPELAPALAAIGACVHCGFCLPVCPTYLELGEEPDSPRGRIYLFRALLAGQVELTPPLIRHFDRCLGCLACQTACPSGVHYGDIIRAARADIERRGRRPRGRAALRRWVLATLRHRDRFRLALRLGRLGQRLAPVLPRRLRDMAGLLPGAPAAPDGLPALTPAVGPRRGRVALLTGCVQDVLAPEINAAAAWVLALNGFEVAVPPGQGCCGALALHAGDMGGARRQAGQTVAALAAAGADFIITTAAGCGSAMKEYGRAFPDDLPLAGVHGRVQDVAEFLAAQGLRAAPGALRLRAAYHDACHLAHGQGIRRQPRDLLRLIPGLELVELPESEVCCGSAGIYNLVEPELAQRLGQRKVHHVRGAAPDVVVTGNVGCQVQIRAGLAAGGSPVPVLHTVELLAWAYGRRPGRVAGAPAR